MHTSQDAANKTMAVALLVADLYPRLSCPAGVSLQDYVTLEDLCCWLNLNLAEETLHLEEAKSLKSVEIFMLTPTVGLDLVYEVVLVLDNGRLHVANPWLP